MNETQRVEFEAFMAERFTDSIDRRRCINGDGNDYMSWDMGVARTVWKHMQQKLDAVVADQKRYEFLAQFFDVDMWDADDYHCVRGLCFDEPKFDRLTIGLPYDMSLEDAIDEHLKRADAAKGGSDD